MQRFKWKAAWLMLWSIGLWLLAACGGPPTAGGPPVASSTPEPPIVVPGPTAQPPLATTPTLPPAGAGAAGYEGTAETPTVTLAEDGQTLTLTPGQRFLLKLGEDSTWTVGVDDPSVVSRVVNVLVVRGAQGLYAAHKAGSTNVTASGEPTCRQAQPPCGAPSRLFRLQVVVR